MKGLNPSCWPSSGPKYLQTGFLIQYMAKEFEYSSSNLLIIFDHYLKDI